MKILKKSKIVFFQAFFHLVLISTAYSLDEIEPDLLDESQSNAKITNLSVNIPRQANVTFDYEHIFPDNFSVSYTKYGRLFNITFIQINESIGRITEDASYPIPSSNIYVIDKKTGNPVVYRLQANKEVS